VKAGIILAGLAFALALFIALLHGMLSNPQLQNAIVSMVFLIAMLWWVWSESPDWIKKLARWFFKRKNAH
jgi:hypothetical protein